jgi:transposase
MVDLTSHRIVDMIASREYAEVKEWLQTYTNITAVSRDGSITYHNAITDALPKAAQISDRFHLLKNLTSYAQAYLRKELGVYIKIQGAGGSRPEIPKPISKAGENRKLTLKEKYDKIQELAASGLSKSNICGALNLDVRVYDKLTSASPEVLAAFFQTTPEIVHEEKTRQKMERVNEVRALKRAGFSVRAISRRAGLDARTIRKYLDDGFNPVHAAYGQKKAGKLTPFAAEIDAMLESGAAGTQIENTIRTKGYAGSASNLRHYISEWKRRRKQIFEDCRSESVTTEILERKHIFKLLYHPLEKVKTVTPAQFEALKNQEPCFEKIHEIVWAFKVALAARDASALDSWAAKAQSLGVAEINSFTEGLLRDWDAVKNAVVLPFSNGLAEGSVNKLKVIKRIMYGRCSFETLKNKTLCLEKLRSRN